MAICLNTLFMIMKLCNYHPIDILINQNTAHFYNVSVKKCFTHKSNIIFHAKYSLLSYMNLHPKTNQSCCRAPALQARFRTRTTSLHREAKACCHPERFRWLSERRIDSSDQTFSRASCHEEAERSDQSRRLSQSVCSAGVRSALARQQKANEITSF